MQVNKISLKPSRFDGISEIIEETVDVTLSDVISKKITLTNGRYNVLIKNSKLDFLESPSKNILALYYGSDLESYDYGSKKFIIDNNFRIDQKYLEHIYEVIKNGWTKELAKMVSDSRLLSFNELAKIVKEKSGVIIKSWEELEKNASISELLEFEHVKQKLDIIKMLFFNLLTSQARGQRCNFIQKEAFDENVKDGFFVYKSSRNYIDKFTLRTSTLTYSCDFDGRVITMYPVIVDLMHEYEINKYMKMSEKFGTDRLIIKTSLDAIEKNDFSINVDHDNGRFARNKSTSNLTLSGIASQSFVVTFNVTMEDIKLTLSKFDKTKSGSKAELLAKLAKLTNEVIEQHKEKLSNYFDSNMIVQFNRAYKTEKSPIIDGIDECIINYVLYAYIKSRIHGSALFLRETENDLYNTENDFCKLDYLIEVKFMRLDEGIT
jgi:hypothetical protein